jgi:dTDP-4-amino-4,6-dideoxygalactose transaminase
VKTISWSDFPLPLVQVNPPSLEDSNAIVITAYKNGIFSNSAELQMRASKTLAEHVNSEFHGYLASSNTMALTACLISIGVRGKHVVISNFTFPATLDAVIMAGGIPIVCDIDSESLVIDLQELRKILQNPEYEIAVILPTRVFGFVSDFSELIALSNSHKIPVVVDAAASLPGKRDHWNFKHHALYEVFSLHATKVFGIGEAGLVVGDHDAIEKVRQRSNFGFVLDGSLKFLDGLNAKADEFTSARALARFEEYSTDVDNRYNFVQIYKNAFSSYPEIRIMSDSPGTIYSYFPIIFGSEEHMLKFQKEISSFILSRRYYFPTIKSGYIGDAKVAFDENLTNSESIAKRILCLPVYVSCEEEVKQEIKKLIEKTLEKIN